MPETSQRIPFIRKKMAVKKVDAFMCLNPVNVNYASGFSGGDSYLLVTKTACHLITDSRYTEQAKEELIKGVKILLIRGKLTDSLGELFKKHRVRTLGFEAGTLTCNIYARLKKAFPKIKFVPMDNTVELMRQTKTPAEVKTLRKIIDITRETFFALQKRLKPGMTEEQIAAEMEYISYKLGAKPGSFWSIVSVNERAALPHAPLTSKKMSANCLLLLDFGAACDFYCSDITRVLFIGKVPDLMKRIYNVTCEAQQRAIDKIRPGAKISESDFAARGYIKKMGFGDFGHGLGHGIGMQVHELPGLSWRSGDQLFEPGMVFTVEPGIYLPGKGGVRMEDMVMVTETGAEVLSSSIPRDIEEVSIRI